MYIINKEQKSHEEINGGEKAYPDDDRDGLRGSVDVGDSKCSGNGSKLRENDTEAWWNEKSVQNNDTRNGASDSRTGRVLNSERQYSLSEPKNRRNRR